MLRHRLVALVAIGMMAVSLLSGCGSDSLHLRQGACGSVTQTVRFGGPLKSIVDGGWATMMAPSGEALQQPGLTIPLQVTGRKPVTIDRVVFHPYQGKPMPTIRAAMVGQHAAKCLVVQPAAHYPSGQEPQLVLTVSSTMPVAYNQNTQVFYHTPSGQAYVAVFNVQFVVCVQGAVTRQRCEGISPTS